MAMDYNKTLNLPKTDFAMRAALPTREPDMLKNWYDETVYEELMKKNQDKPLFVLHDGPPYANGKIHLGTSLNKILKDFIIRHKNMTGFKAPYVPGYDTHGLPTELKARKDAGVKSAEQISPLELRKICKEYALRFVDEQKVQFQRLGVIGDWENPYLTLKPEFVAKQIEVFGEMANKGYIYKGLKPVYWCPECETALAEAEIEYAEDTCHSIFVKFKVKDDLTKFSSLNINLDKTYFVIWTTTTWTLPGNLAICLGPNYQYCIIKTGDEYLVMAEDLYKSAFDSAGISDYEVIATLKGSEFELMTTYHPFLDRESLVIVGDHVTLESGTGCVHTAPGHGVEDFEVCRKYPQIDMVVPVDAKGILTADAGEFEGLSTEDANKAIAKKLDSTGNLFGLSKIIHQYPHCWRCKSPILFRATEQCFCSISAFSDKAVSEIEKINWNPSWGMDRIKSMIIDRSDWCISRQRTWGVPIPLMYCKDCGKQIISPETIKHIADTFRKEGADAWYANDASYLLPEGFACPDCHGSTFKKETDIMDVWFDSGVTHFAVLDEREDLRWPADLYLEGADQYRGWFQSSLLTAVACRGKAPYKNIVTHGWVVDGEGKKQSKSLGNTIEPSEVIDQYGADILRLWVASSDYHQDIRISPEILKQLSEGYRKIRNTARFILGCISDFDPKINAVPESELEAIDKFALMQLAKLVEKVNAAYNNYEYHVIYHAIHNFCVVDMSNFYLDVLKDRLYVASTDSATRRAAQTTIHKILKTLTLLISPILAFTADEIWKFIPQTDDMNMENVLYNQIPTSLDVKYDDKLFSDFTRIGLISGDIKKALEIARNSKVIGASLAAKVTIFSDSDTAGFLSEFKNEIASYFIVSEVEILCDGNGDYKGEYVEVTVSPANGEKCERCWIFSETVGQSEKHPTLCQRCSCVEEVNI